MNASIDPSQPHGDLLGRKQCNCPIQAGVLDSSITQYPNDAHAEKNIIIISIIHLILILLSLLVLSSPLFSIS